MKGHKRFGILISGFTAGAINGLFGAGGGMVLVPLFTLLTDLEDDEIFPSSVSVILPVCLISLSFSLIHTNINWDTSLLYLLGSAAGGVLAGLFGRKIPTNWLHKSLGILILWGGIRYLC